MKTCPECNKRVEGDLKFCPHCGMDLQNVPDDAQDKGMSHGFLSKRKNVGIVLATLVTVIVGIFLFVNRTRTINLDDYVTVEFSGYDGVGEANAVFNYEQFNTDLEEMFGEREEKKDIEDISSKKDLEEFFNGKKDVYSEARSEIDYTLDKEEGLFNGDKVNVTFKYNNENLKKYHLKFESDKKEFTVENLNPVEEVDPFENVKLSISGASPFISVEAESDYGWYTCEPSSNLKKGDKVTVTIDGYNEEDTRSVGYVYTSTTKEYTIGEDVDAYVEKVEDIPDDEMKKLKIEANAYIQLYFDDYYDGSSKTSELKEEGALVMMLDEYKDEYTMNDLYIIYSTVVSSDENNFEDTKVYFPVYYSNVIRTKDGTITADAEPTISGESTLDEESIYSTKGFKDANTMYNELVGQYVNDYQIDMTDGLKKYFEK